MITSISAMQSYQLSYSQLITSDQSSQEQAIIPRDLRIQSSQDTLDLGKNEALTNDQSMQVVLNTAMDKLRSVVSDAKKALGMSEDQQIDTSPEATGNRIADFALGAFSKWSEQHTGLSEDDARQQFADFIGGAVQEGISQARGILQSLSALNSDVDNNISSTWDVVQSRLNDFVANGTTSAKAK